MADSSETAEVLEDIRRWVKVIGLRKAKPVLKDALSHEDNDRQRDLRIVYHLTNGNNSRRDIEDKISFSRGWVEDRHTEWSNMGLIEQSDSQGKYRHIISLKEAGMEVPEPRDEGGDKENSEIEDSG